MLVPWRHPPRRQHFKGPCTRIPYPTPPHPPQPSYIFCEITRFRVYFHLNDSHRKYQF